MNHMWKPNLNKQQQQLFENLNILDRELYNYFLIKQTTTWATGYDYYYYNYAKMIDYATRTGVT